MVCASTLSPILAWPFPSFPTTPLQSRRRSYHADQYSAMKYGYIEIENALRVPSYHTCDVDRSLMDSLSPVGNSNRLSVDRTGKSNCFTLFF